MLEVIFNLLFFMWILDEAMHNTEHNPRRHWHKTLILAEGKTIEKKDFLMFFISKLNLILIDHKLSALGEKNKGGKTHTLNGYAFLSSMLQVSAR